jgi:hypothetical protein
MSFWLHQLLQAIVTRYKFWAFSYGKHLPLTIFKSIHQWLSKNTALRTNTPLLINTCGVHTPYLHGFQNVDWGKTQKREIKEEITLALGILAVEK